VIKYSTKEGASEKRRAPRISGGCNNTLDRGLGGETWGTTYHRGGTTYQRRGGRVDCAGCGRRNHGGNRSKAEPRALGGIPEAPSPGAWSPWWRRLGGGWSLAGTCGGDEHGRTDATALGWAGCALAAAAAAAASAGPSPWWGEWLLGKVPGPEWLVGSVCCCALAEEHGGCS
jgi:hypothetical protein